jgi:hypothetical protein
MGWLVDRLHDSGVVVALAYAFILASPNSPDVP